MASYYPRSKASIDYVVQVEWAAEQTPSNDGGFAASVATLKKTAVQPRFVLARARRDEQERLDLASISAAKLRDADQDEPL